MSEKEPNLFVIVADSLRADSIPEEIQEISESLEGVNFKNAFSTANATIDSMPSLTYGVYSDKMGRTNPELTSLAEYLEDEGYDSSLWTDNRVMNSSKGLNKGFSGGENKKMYRHKVQELVQVFNSNFLFQSAQSVYFQIIKPFLSNFGQNYHYKPAGKLYQRVLESLGDSDRPQFHLIHCMDTHYPYEPPQEYIDKYEFNTSSDRDKISHLTSKVMITSGKESLTQRDVDDCRQAYEASVDYWAEETRKFLSKLMDRGHFNPEKDILVITSDHGECFDLEKNMLGHTPSPAYWEELIHVPLVVSSPDWGYKEVSGQVSHIDLVPTVLEMMDKSVPDTFQGDSASSPEGMARENVFLTSLGPEKVFRGVRTDKGSKMFSDRTRNESNKFISGSGTERVYLLETKVEDGSEKIVNRFRFSENYKTDLNNDFLLDIMEREHDGLVESSESRTEDVKQQLRELGYHDEI